MARPASVTVWPDTHPARPDADALSGRFHPTRQHAAHCRERKRAVAEQLIVEANKVEAISITRLELATQCDDLAHACHVGQRLTGPRDVTISLGLGLELRQADV